MCNAESRVNCQSLNKSESIAVLVTEKVFFKHIAEKRRIAADTVKQRHARNKLECVNHSEY